MSLVTGNPGSDREAAGPERDRIEREIARMIEPGLRENAWRSDYQFLRERRFCEEEYHARRIRMLRRAIPKLRRKLILDLGCGRGGLSVALRRESFRVVALDLRRSNCRVTWLRGRRHGLEVPVVRGRGERLPFPKGVFDVVLCRDVLEHVRQPLRLLREIRRVLRRRGSCFITVSNRFAPVDPHYHLAGVAFLPRSAAERYIRWRRREKGRAEDRQRLSEMNYYGYRAFRRIAADLGFEADDLRLRQLRRYRGHGLSNGLRWLAYVLLRPFALQANHFEFLLTRRPLSPGLRGEKT